MKRFILEKQAIRFLQLARFKLDNDKRSIDPPRDRAATTDVSPMEAEAIDLLCEEHGWEYD